MTSQSNYYKCVKCEKEVSCLFDALPACPYCKDTSGFEKSKFNLISRNKMGLTSFVNKLKITEDEIEECKLSTIQFKPDEKLKGLMEGEYGRIMIKERGSLASATQAMVDAIKKYPIVQEYDESKDMNTFLELIETLEYSFKNGMKKEAVILLREKIINMFNEACWKNEAQLMETAPLYGTKILAEFDDFAGFDVIHSDGQKWLDSDDYPIPFRAIKWWPLPKIEKVFKPHTCKHGSVECVRISKESSFALIVRGIMHDPIILPHCPFCGEKA